MASHVILYSTIPADLQAQLAEKSNLTVVDALRGGRDAEVRAALAVAEGMIGVNEKVDTSILDLAPQLRVLSTISVGYDAFDVAELTRRGILLLHTPDVLTETTADMILLLMLGVARRATELLELMRQGRWRSRIGPDLYGTDLYGKKVGILGMGRIGRAVARRCHAGFAMEVLYCSRSASPGAEEAYRARRCSLGELLAEADFVCLTLPLNEKTRNLIGRKELATMRPEAFLINGGRGQVVDEEALIEALQQGTIAGAGLDVYQREPLPADSPLLRLTNLFTLPHAGSATRETRHAMARVAVENLLAALAGRAKTNLVNPEVLGPASGCPANGCSAKGCPAKD